jgi:hypothetical protein
VSPEFESINMWCAAISQVPGVRRVMLRGDVFERGKGYVLVEYKFWTRILPWRLRKAEQRVAELIYEHPPSQIEAASIQPICCPEELFTIRG